MWNPRRPRSAEPLSIKIWSLSTHLYMWSIFTWHGYCVVGSLTRSFNLWWSMDWVRTHLLCELWLWLVSSLFPLNASSVLQFERRVDVCKLIMSKPQLKPRVISSAEWCCCCSIFLGVFSKPSSALSVCFLSDSTFGKMSKIIPRGNEEIWRRWVWCKILSYLKVIENSNIIQFMSQIEQYAWENTNGNCLCRKGEWTAICWVLFCTYNPQIHSAQILVLCLSL